MFLRLANEDLHSENTYLLPYNASQGVCRLLSLTSHENPQCVTVYLLLCVKHSLQQSMSDVMVICSKS